MAKTASKKAAPQKKAAPKPETAQDSMETIDKGPDIQGASSNAPEANEAFPAHLANKKNETPVNLPPLEKPNDDFHRDRPGGVEKDRKAAEAVRSGHYKPGVLPPLAKGQRHFEAPDGVVFAGDDKDDLMKDPRNGQMIRPRRAPAPGLNLKGIHSHKEGEPFPFSKQR